MSECNFCTYERLKKKLPKDHKITKIRSGFNGGLGGVDIYIHPKNVKLKELSDIDKKQYWKIWFMELPNRCAC